MKNLFSRSRSLRELKRFFRENAAQGKPLCILNDLVFKAMFVSDTEDSREALRRLLSACIHREVSTVRVINNELVPAHLDAKAVRLDVNVTFNDGEVADLEMQIGKSDDDLRARAAYYAGMLLSGQSQRGVPYKEIKRVYQIFFLDCTLFPQSDRLQRRYVFMEKHEHDQLTEAVEIIFYEMPKLEELVNDYFAGKTGTESLSDDEKWCIYMKYRHEKRAEPLIIELCRKEEGIMRAEKTLEKVSRDYLKFVRNMNIRKNEYERAVMKEAARQEGLAEGQTKGREEACYDFARKMKNAGRPLNEIVEFTGLSPDIINKL